MHLTYDLTLAPPLHPHEVLRDLGITYQHATPQSVFESWWLWNCENCPNPLPPFLAPLTISPMKAVGNGLSTDWARAIEKREIELRAAPAPVPDDQQQVIDEKKALDKKLGKLTLWLATSAESKGLPRPERRLLRLQIGHMRCYSDLLGMRIAGFAQAKEESNG
jgi:hypothetical protein